MATIVRQSDRDGGQSLGHGQGRRGIRMVLQEREVVTEEEDINVTNRLGICTEFKASARRRMRPANKKQSTEQRVIMLTRTVRAAVSAAASSPALAFPGDRSRQKRLQNFVPPRGAP